MAPAVAASRRSRFRRSLWRPRPTERRAERDLRRDAPRGSRAIPSPRWLPCMAARATSGGAGATPAAPLDPAAPASDLDAEASGGPVVFSTRALYEKLFQMVMSRSPSLSLSLSLLSTYNSEETAYPFDEGAAGWSDEIFVIASGITLRKRRRAGGAVPILDTSSRSTSVW